jgi:hypothetical protein
MADAPEGTIRDASGTQGHYDATSEAPVAGYVTLDSGRVGSTLTGGDDWSDTNSESPYKQV